MQQCLHVLSPVPFSAGTVPFSFHLHISTCDILCVGACVTAVCVCAAGGGREGTAGSLCMCAHGCVTTILQMGTGDRNNEHPALSNTLS